jgi:hypothetical protein
VVCVSSAWRHHVAAFPAPRAGGVRGDAESGIDILRRKQYARGEARHVVLSLYEKFPDIGEARWEWWSRVGTS